MKGSRFRFILVWVVLSCAACSPRPAPLPTLTRQPCPAIEKGIAFLKSQFNPALGLLREAPAAAPHTYWLCNDNALAAYVLEQLGESELSATLRATLKRYGVEKNGLIEVTWGISIFFPPNEADNQTIARIGEDVIMNESHEGRDRPMNDWAEYANLAFLGALNDHWQGLPDNATNAFKEALGLFDGTGFKDKAFSGQYETYKVALALYAGSILQASLPQRDTLCSILLSMQNTEGGFYTHYTRPGQPAGDVNTETTSFALLALMKACPCSN